MNVNPVIMVAKNEIVKILHHPLTIIIIILILSMIVLNSAASSYKLSLYETTLRDIGDVFMTVGISTIIFNISLLLTILSLFLGLSSISDERANGRLNLLFTKPLYRNEILIGKFFGLCLFILALTAVSIFLSSLSIALIFRMPFSIEDTLLRLLTFILVIFLNCTLSLGLTVLFGVIFPKYYHALVCTVSYLYLTWFMIWPDQLRFISSWLPSTVFFKITDPEPGTIFLLNTTITFSEWLGAAYPFILVLSVMMIMIIVCSQAIFSLKEV